MPIDPTPIAKKEQPEYKPQKAKDRTSPSTIEFFISEPQYHFSDVILHDVTQQEIQDAIAVFQFREKLFVEWKLGTVIKSPPNICLNFYGDPGTGKTMAANAVAAQLSVPLIRVNYADIESKYVGETSKNLTRLFDMALQKNALLLFDEADALLSKRVTEMSSATDVSVNQTRSVLLTLLDRFSGIAIFTTNFISNYDPAFMRRIPYHIHFPLPDEDGRLALLQHYLANTVPNSIDFLQIARKHQGISGADIANATLTAALRTARAGRDVMSQADFEAALERIAHSKRDNRKEAAIQEREVSEEYALSQIKQSGGNL